MNGIMLSSQTYFMINLFSNDNETFTGRIAFAKYN
jgi:hypothetical protein